METNIAEFKIDPNRLALALSEAQEQLTNGELVLDFSSVRRIDAAGLKAMEQLTGLAHDKSVKLILRSVNVELYKVLKLMNLVPRLSFVH